MRGAERERWGDGGSRASLGSAVGTWPLCGGFCSGWWAAVVIWQSTPSPLPPSPSRSNQEAMEAMSPALGCRSPHAHGLKAVPPSRRQAAWDHGRGRHGRPRDWGTSFPERLPGPGHTHACRWVNRASGTLAAQPWAAGRALSTAPLGALVTIPALGWDRLGGGQGLCLTPSSAAPGHRDGSSTGRSLREGPQQPAPTGRLLDPGHKLWRH